MEIVEIIERSEQGVTQPFLCRTADDCLYYVKGPNDLPRRELVAELLAAELGREWGLDLPNFDVLELSRVVASRAEETELGSPGHGLVFGSEVETRVIEVSYADLQRIPLALRQDIAAFDYWIGNTDRTLSVLGGNPNMLLKLDTDELLIFDHNQSFDFSQTQQAFLVDHVFASELVEALRDPSRVEDYEKRHDATLRKWDELIRSIPEEWFFHDSQQTIDVDFSIDDFKRWLERDHRTRRTM